jgi:hypothetical protein
MPMCTNLKHSQAEQVRAMQAPQLKGLLAVHLL